MGFNFSAAEAYARKQIENKALFAVIVGASGAGKSSAIGTLPGKTLLIYGSGESHGPKAAQALGGNVTPICIDVDDAGKPLTADETTTRLMSILLDVDGIKAAKFTSVAIDGAPELEAIFYKTTRFVQMCTTDKGKFDTWQKGPSSLTMLREVVSALKTLHGLGLHVVVTCRAEVKAANDNGVVEDCSASLTTYKVAQDFVSLFDDILLVSLVAVGDKRGHVFQFQGSITKTSKDVEGKIKKTSNFAPRVTGAKEIPELVKADLKKIIELKSAKEAK